MHDPAATLKIEATHRNFTKDMSPSRTKFLYPSGSKPLEGYTIKRGIGTGGFGEVYFALSDAGKEVALKRIQRNLDVELRGVRQCLNLKHVNLISLWDIRTNDAGESWVVMEYVPGKSLRCMLDIFREGLPDDQVKTWFASTAAGVAYLHDRGIVHRDLKPGNIFCDEDEQVIKIGDYGLSKFISCSRRSGQTESVGTFHYMAPEIGKGVYGKEIDVYAMGIILYELLTGRVPYEGESSQEIIMKHLTAEPDLSILPEGFVEPIRRCLLKDPDERYSTVPELLCDVPWPDIAENSKNIVTRHAIGPIGTNPAFTEPTPDQDNRVEIEPLLLREEFNRRDRDEIVFGELRDTSPGKRNGNVSGVRPTTAPHPRETNHPPAEVIVDRVEVVSPVNSTTPTSPGPELAIEDSGPLWKRLATSMPVKILALATFAVLLAKNASFILPISLGLGLLYLLYYAAKTWMSKADHAVDGDDRDLRVG